MLGLNREWTKKIADISLCVERKLKLVKQKGKLRIIDANTLK
jgi:hypothetical protein